MAVLILESAAILSPSQLRVDAKHQEKSLPKAFSQEALQRHLTRFTNE